MWNWNPELIGATSYGNAYTKYCNVPRLATCFLGFSLVGRATQHVTGERDGICGVCVPALERVSDIELKVDAQEPPIVHTTFRAYTEFDTVPAILKVGDIEFGDIIIERKTITDFITSIRQDLFWRKLAVMQESYNEAYLYLEWTDEEFISAVIHRKNPVYVLHAIEGAYQTLDDQKYLVKHFSTLDRCAKYFTDKFARKLKTGTVHTAPNVPRKVNRSWEELRVIALACIPKIGYKTADKLLGDGTLLDVVLASLTTDEQVEAVAKQRDTLGKHSELVRKFFCTRDD